MTPKTKTREEMIRDFLQSAREHDDRQNIADESDESTEEEAEFAQIAQIESAELQQDSAPIALPPGDYSGDTQQFGDGDEVYSDVGNLRLVPEEAGNALIIWDGPEFKTFRQDMRWYTVAVVVLLLIITYAVIVNSPIMAITFILIGIVGYIYLQKQPRHLTFAVTYEGVAVGNELYPFDNIESFWIFYEPPHTYLLSITVKGHFIQHIHIPLHNVDPIALREALIQFVPEEKREMGVVDTIERLLHV